MTTLLCYSTRNRTTPCKAFQRGECKLAANECQYAHIMPPVSRANTTPCFDFLRGHCRYGEQCRWSHEIQDGNTSRCQSTQVWPARAAHVAHISHPTSHPQPQTLSSHLSPFVSYQDVCSAPPPSPPETPSPDLYSFVFREDSLFASSSSPTATDVSSDVESITELSHYATADHILHPAFNNLRDPSAWPLSPPASTAIQQQQQPFCAPPYEYSTHSPTALYGVQFPYLEQPSEDLSLLPVDVPSCHRRRRSIRPGAWAKKIQVYGTKPCRYFTESGHCPKGDRCTFAHGPKESRFQLQAEAKHRPPPLTVTLPLYSSGDSEHSPDSPPVRWRNRNTVEDMRARGFYPITWRVIGGGVKMSGTRPCQGGICQLGPDCPYIHDESDAEDDLYCPDKPAIHDASNLSATPSPTRLSARGTTPVLYTLVPVLPLKAQAAQATQVRLFDIKDLPPRAQSTPPVLMRPRSETESLIVESPKICTVESPPVF